MNKIIKIISSLSRGFILWTGVAMTVVGFSHTGYALFGLGILIVYSFLNDFALKGDSE